MAPPARSYRRSSIRTIAVRTAPPPAEAHHLVLTYPHLPTAPHHPPQVIAEGTLIHSCRKCKPWYDVCPSCHPVVDRHAQRNAYSTIVKDLEAAKASAEARAEELEKEKKVLDVEWMAAEARALAAEARAAAAEARRPGGRGAAADDATAMGAPAGNPLLEARLLTMLVRQGHVLLFKRTRFALPPDSNKRRNSLLNHCNRMRRRPRWQS